MIFQRNFLLRETLKIFTHSEITKIVLKIKFNRRQKPFVTWDSDIVEDPVYHVVAGNYYVWKWNDYLRS